MPLPSDLFDYSLPERLIAQTPCERRDQSRLLVVDRKTRSVAHRLFSDLPEYLRPNDLLVRNAAAVLPARLHGRRSTGGAVECFLLRQATTETPNEWWCLVRPGRKLPPGERFSHDSGSFSASVLARDAEGAALVRFEIPSGLCITELANRLGTVPLPPYIHRDSGDDRRALDLERYQTVYANRQRQVAVAAPTAGLHFTPELIKRLSASGIRFADVLLHVGLGTFKPIATPYIEDHPIHTELYEISPETQQDLLLPHPGRRIAVGTTSVRTVEDFLAKQSLPSPLPYLGEASLYLHPPGNFRGIDALITNFHQPRSTLLCLVSAFLCPGSTEGIAWSRELYAEAIAREYRFFSYGDAMLIL